MNTKFPMQDDIEGKILFCMELTATIQQQVFVNLLWFRSDISTSYIGLLIADMSSGKGKGLASKAKGGNNFLEQINETKRKREK